MNKKTKGLITAALGASLLLGSAGTFALWYDTAALTGDNIATGDLALGTPSFAWKWENVSYTTSTNYKGATITLPKTLVPGDKVIGTSTNVDFKLAGDTLVASLVLEGAGLYSTSDPLVKSLTIAGVELAPDSNGKVTITGLTPAAAGSGYVATAQVVNAANQTVALNLPSSFVVQEYVGLPVHQVGGINVPVRPDGSYVHYTLNGNAVAAGTEGAAPNQVAASGTAGAGYGRGRATAANLTGLKLTLSQTTGGASGTTPSVLVPTP